MSAGRDNAVDRASLVFGPMPWGQLLRIRLGEPHALPCLYVAGSARCRIPARTPMPVGQPATPKKWAYKPPSPHIQNPETANDLRHWWS